MDFVTSEEKLKKLAAQLSFKQFNNFHENVAAVERARGELTLNLPIYVGFAIWIFRKRWCMISTTIISNKQIHTRRCYLPKQIVSRIKFQWIMCMKMSMLICIYSIFLGTKESPFYDDENKRLIGKKKGEPNGEITE